MTVFIEEVALKRSVMKEIEAASDLYSGHFVILRTGLHMARHLHAPHPLHCYIPEIGTLPYQVCIVAG